MQIGTSRLTKLFAVAMALYSYFLIKANLARLPSRIPTHFNFAGKPDGWGSPHVLWVLLAIQVLIAFILLFVPLCGRRFPRAVHLGAKNLSDFTPEQRELMMPLLEKMAGLMSLAASLFFVYLIRETIRTAEVAHPRTHMDWALGLFIGTMTGLPLYYIHRINADSARCRSAH